MKLPYEWLGRYQHPEDREIASSWSNKISPDDYWHARFRGWNIGAWTKSSIHTSIRSKKIDLSSQEMRKICREFLESNVIAGLALERLYDDYQPETMLLFNARQGSTRVAYELARRRNIDVIAHEVPVRNVNGRLLLRNARIHDLSARKKFWSTWCDQPLTENEVERLSKYLAERASSQQENRFLFDKTNSQIPSQPKKKLFTLFTSSEDEVIAEDSWSSPFDSQREWIQYTAEFATKRDDIRFIVRIHPNTGGGRALAGGDQTLLHEFKSLLPLLPPNMDVVMPEDKVNSYDLVHASTAGIIMHSTIGLEMACRGKHVVSVGDSFISDTSFATTTETKKDYHAQLQAICALPNQHIDEEIRRDAFRLAYGVFFRQCIDFPLVECKRKNNTWQGQPKYQNLEALKPGQDENLDRICDIILKGYPIIPFPKSSADRDPSDEKKHLRAYSESFALA